MENELLFSEKQRFKQWWLWAILIGVNALMLSLVFTQIVNGRIIGDKPATNSQLITGAAISLLITIFILSIRLDTQIKTDGIYVKFFPLQTSFRFFTWNSLQKCYVRKYSPIAEYGGWGWRLGLFGKGVCYNISGNQGLQLVFMNGKKLLIGTQKPEAVTEVVKKCFLQQIRKKGRFLFFTFRLPISVTSYLPVFSKHFSY